MDECPDKMELGKRLRMLRKKAGFRSAKAFAEFAGFTTTGYAEFEQGRSRLTYEKAWKIADALGISLDELGGRQWPPEGAAASADPMRDELVRCYDASTAENRHSLVVAARNAALASGEAAERGADKGQVSA